MWSSLSSTASRWRAKRDDARGLGFVGADAEHDRVAGGDDAYDGAHQRAPRLPPARPASARRSRRRPTPRRRGGRRDGRRREPPRCAAAAAWSTRHRAGRARAPAARRVRRRPVRAPRAACRRDAAARGPWSAPAEVSRSRAYRARGGTGIMRDALDRRDPVSPPSEARVPVSARARDAFGLTPEIVAVSSAMFVMGLGENLWRRFLPKYLEHFGAPITAIGLFGTAEDFLDGVPSSAALAARLRRLHPHLRGDGGRLHRALRV